MQADFQEEMDYDTENQHLYARLIATLWPGTGYRQSERQDRGLFQRLSSVSLSSRCSRLGHVPRVTVTHRRLRLAGESSTMLDATMDVEGQSLYLIPRKHKEIWT